MHGFQKTILAGIAASLSGLAIAEQQDQQQGFGLEEVIVTAQRKAESLQDAPISIAALTAEDLEKEGITNLFDLKAKVPNLTVDFHPVSNQTVRLFIRGTGSIDPLQITQDSPIGVYLDGVYIARSTGMAFDIAELQRIEVLRGPQGTLYGRNSTGGTINLITARPDPSALSYKQKLTAGNWGQRAAKFNLNLPIGSDAAVKLAYLTSRQDGFIENTGEGGDFGDRESEGVRLDFSWDVHDNLRLDYGYDKSKVRVIGYSLQAIAEPHDDNGSGTPIEIFQNRLGQEAKQFYDYPGKDVRADSLYSAVPLDYSTNIIEGHSLTLGWNLGETQLIKYIAGYREMRDRTNGVLSAGSSSDEYRIDYSAYTSKDGSLFLPTTPQPLDQDQISHELQWQGSAFGGRLEYIAGLYYFEENGKEHHPLHHILNGPIDITETPLFTNTTSVLMAEDSRFTVNNKASAIFTQLDYTLPFWDDRLSIILGARHSEDRRTVDRYRDLRIYLENETIDKVSGESIATAPLLLEEAGSNFQVSAAKKFSDDSFTLVLSAELSDNVNAYVKFAEAYKSGGYNTREPDPARFAEGFEEEKVESLEVGIKSELLDRRLRLNVNLFDSDFSNRQMNFKLPGAVTDTRVLNAGVSRMRGIETDIMFVVTRKLITTASFSLLDAEMVSVINPDTGEDQTEQYTFFAAPELSWSLGLNYDVADFSWGRLTANMSYNYTDDTNMDNRVDFVEDSHMDGYGLINGRVGLYEMALAGGSVDVSLWSKNLTDEEYVVSTVPGIFPHTSRGVYWGPQRTIGLDINYQY